MYDAINAYEDEFFKGDIDFRDGLPFFHVEVKQELGKPQIRSARAVFGEIKKVLVSMGHERLYAYTPSRHFARLVGGGFIDIPVQGIEDSMQLIVWELVEV